MRFNLQFFAENDIDNGSSYSDLDLDVFGNDENYEDYEDELSDVEIDELLGKENTDTEGMGSSFGEDDEEETKDEKSSDKKKKKKTLQSPNKKPVSEEYIPEPDPAPEYVQYTQEEQVFNDRQSEESFSFTPGYPIENSNPISEPVLESVPEPSVENIQGEIADEDNFHRVGIILSDDHGFTNEEEIVDSNTLPFESENNSVLNVNEDQVKEKFENSAEDNRNYTAFDSFDASSLENIVIPTPSVTNENVEIIENIKNDSFEFENATIEEQQNTDRDAFPFSRDNYDNSNNNQNQEDVLSDYKENGVVNVDSKEQYNSGYKSEPFEEQKTSFFDDDLKGLKIAPHVDEIYNSRVDSSVNNFQINSAPETVNTGLFSETRGFEYADDGKAKDVVVNENDLFFGANGTPNINTSANVEKDPYQINYSEQSEKDSRSTEINSKTEYQDKADAKSERKPENIETPVPESKENAAKDEKSSTTSTNEKPNNGDKEEDSAVILTKNDATKKEDTKENNEGRDSHGTSETQEEARKQDAYNIQEINNHEKSTKIIHTAENILEGISSRAVSTVERSEDKAVSGVVELKNSVPVSMAKMLLANSGANSSYASAKIRDKNIDSATKEAEKLIAQGKLNVSDLQSPAGLKTLRSATGTDLITSKNLVRYHKEIATNLSAKAYFEGIASLPSCPFTQNELNFIKSDKFYSSCDTRTYNNILKKALQNNSTAARNLNFSRMSQRDYKKIARNPSKYGLDASAGSAIRKGAFVNKNASFKAKADGIRGKISRFRRAGSVLIRRVLSADEGMANSINAASRTFAVSRMMVKGSVVSLKIAGRAVGFDKIKNKVGKSIKRNITDPMKATASRKAHEATKNIKKSLNHKRDKFLNTKAGQKFNGAKKSAQKNFKNISDRVKNSSFSRGAKKAAKTTKKVAKTTANVTGKLSRVLSAPGRLLGKIFNVFNVVKKWILIVVGGFALFIVLIRFLISAFIGLASMFTVSDFSALSDKIMDETVGIFNNVINYDSYKDLREDVENLLEKDKEVMEKVLELANGKPKNPNVWDGHTVDRYGFPGDKNSDGEERLPYYIHYIDKDGNELLSQTTVAKDVEALAISMIGNELGGYYSAKKDMTKLDAMLEEIYDMCVWIDPETGLPFKYRESEPEACFEGCEDYNWECYDESAYDEYARLKGEKVKFYGECENSLTPEYDEMGCCPIEGEEIEDEFGNPTGEYEDDEPGCEGHSCKHCFGHKYVEIYVILLDVDSVVDAYRNGTLVIDFDYQVSGEHEHIEDSGYRDRWDKIVNNNDWKRMTKEFKEKGSWNSDWYYERALSYKTPDSKYGTWLDLYGIDPELGAGFGVSSGFTDEEIEEIVAKMQFDGTISADQQKILEIAMSYVGKFKYSNDPKSHQNLYNGGTGGYSECSGFVSGVLKQAGFDTGNWTCADLKNKTGIVKGGTLTPGCVVTRIGYGNKSNHTMIYAGDAGNGRSYVIDCSSDAKGTAYRTVSNSYLAQYQYTMYPWIKN